MAISFWQSLTRRWQSTPAAQAPEPPAPPTKVPTPEPVHPSIAPVAAAPTPAAAVKKDDTHKQKQLRTVRREQLSQLVQESMLRSGIVGTAYKFKAISLDAAGEQFLVLFELEGPGLDTQHSHLNQVGESLKTLVHSRAPELHVKQVYWHVNNPPEKATPPRPKREMDFLPTQPMDSNDLR